MFVVRYVFYVAYYADCRVQHYVLPLYRAVTEALQRFSSDAIFNTTSIMTHVTFS